MTLFRLSLTAGLSLCGAIICLSQTPDVAVFAEMRPSLMGARNGPTVLSWNDVDGYSSTVGFRLNLENGARMKVAQRLQRMPGDPDSLEEGFVELRSEWRVGKQFMPFGRKALVREAVLGATFNTRLVFDGVPIEVMAFDSGPTRPRGVSARIGSRFGASFATGNHLVAQGGSLTPFRVLEAAPGTGRGYRLAFGADSAFGWAGGLVTVEYLGLRDGETVDDRSMDLSDLRASWKLGKAEATIEFGWARDWTEAENRFRLAGTWDVSQKVKLMPLVRFDRKGIWDFGIQAVAKL